MNAISLVPPGGTILIVDDTPTNLAVVATRLEEQGFEVLIAQDGEEALGRVSYAHPDLILLDIMLPGIDGFEICHRLKADVLTQDIPIIFMTALGNTEDKLAAFQAGAVDYVTKPFQIDEVLARVRTHLALHFLQQKLVEHNRRLENEVAERRKAELELKAANSELESFAHAVSHDLRAPLRQMSGCAQVVVLNYGDQLPPECRPFLDQIIQSGQKTGELIEGLLRLSRSVRGELQCEWVDLSALAEVVRADLERSEPGRSVCWDIAPGLRAWGDARLLDVVMRNLLANAWKYTSATAEPRISVYSPTKSSESQFCVEDNGAGFDMKKAGKLFQPFQRLHRESEFPGVGIGLATVQRVVTRHGGNIGVNASPGSGATFCFTLPEPAEAA